MFFRAIALSVALLVGIGTIIPFINDSTQARPYSKVRKNKIPKKYSKAWWRWYHRKLRKKRAILVRKRALRAKRILLARKKMSKGSQALVGNSPETERLNLIVPLKNTQNSKKITETLNPKNEFQFPVNDKNGKSLGTAFLAIVGQAAVGNSDGNIRKIGGIPTSSLRKNVVNKMVKADGWVVNDYQKTINGKNVYVVIAQSSAKGVVNSHLFYFTEVGGKIYSLSAISSNESQELLAQESEKILKSIHQGNLATQVGLK